MDRNLAGAAAAADAVSAGLVHAPAKGLDVDLVLVLVVLRFSLDPVQLQKHVNGHGGVLLQKATRFGMVLDVLHWIELVFTPIVGPPPRGLPEIRQDFFRGPKMPVLPQKTRE